MSCGVGKVAERLENDTIMNTDEILNYPTEFFNSLDIPGVPQNALSLKIGARIILLRHINAPRMCNGPRLAVKKLMLTVIEAKILNCNSKGEDVLIPLLPVIPTDIAFEI